MRFSPWPYGVSVSDFKVLEAAPPMIAEPLGVSALFPDMPAQVPPRSSRWTPEQRYLRIKQARAWRAVRGVIQNMAAPERQDFLMKWRHLRNPIYPASPKGISAYLAAYKEKK
ncbi:hypothetical protein [Acetobacter persici]|uniref:hypothetical protein n=1 Tax=Acetobacter persici TaxID=1076596 RepID=UPI001BA69137|nr:hypothetical protein [Acetobacter persici]MBS1017113.1 hypothetical protein [Acetobacter persici]